MSPYMPINFNIGSSGGWVYAISNSNVSLSLSLARDEATSLWCCLLRVSSILTNETLKIASKTSSLTVWNFLQGTQTHSDSNFSKICLLPARSKVENATFRAERLWRWRWEGIAWHLKKRQSQFGSNNEWLGLCDQIGKVPVEYSRKVETKTLHIFRTQLKICL